MARKPAVCKIWDMRFVADGYFVSTWELDGVYGDKIPGSEEQTYSGSIDPDFYTPSSKHIWAFMSEAVEERAKRTAENRYVLGEVWEADNSRPSMKFYGSVKRRGCQPAQTSTS